MNEVYKESLEDIGGTCHLAVGCMVRISPFASLMRGELATVMGASIPLKGRVCVKGDNGTIGHYTPSMLERLKP